MLSCLWAAAGAMANRLEDLQSTATPVQVLVTVPFFATFAATAAVFVAVARRLHEDSPLQTGRSPSLRSAWRRAA